MIESSPNPDRLAQLLAHFSVSAQAFHTGALCDTVSLPQRQDAGQLHLIQHGPLQVRHGATVLHIDTPSLLLYPRPLPRVFVPEPQQPAKLACANLLFEGGASNPIAHALPDWLCLPLQDIEGAASVLDLILDEASTPRCGRDAMLNRLFEILMVQILRHLMERGVVQAGMLAGLAHPRLRHALVAMHEAPGRAWSLDMLAAQAGMSRSVFANQFRNVVGCTPGVYLQRWRIGMAQRLLRQGVMLSAIADATGYGSEAALSRAFKASTQLSPRQWRAQQASGPLAA